MPHVIIVSCSKTISSELVLKDAITAADPAQREWYWPFEQ